MFAASASVKIKKIQTVSVADQPQRNYQYHFINHKLKEEIRPKQKRKRKYLHCRKQEMNLTGIKHNNMHKERRAGGCGDYC